jgi:PKD repeat protein
LQYKNKKNLYKIIFITILLGFIISLVGCNWLSFGLLNIFDPQAQVRLNYSEVNLEDGSISLEIYSLNEVEFIGSGFEYDYYVGTTKIDSLYKMVGVTFYVEPSTSPGTPGPITKIDNMPLYFQEVLDYLTLNPLITELTCNISMVGVDGAGHSISETVTVDLPALQPGIDFYPPTAVINVLPDTTGTAPFTVVFDASESTDDRGIASYAWDFGDETTGTGITESHTYDIPGLYFVTLTVTDFYGNEGYDTVTITVNEPEAPTAVITTVPDPPTGSAPLTIYFDAYDSAADPECEFGCEIVSYGWDFGDETIGTGVATNHTYDNPGLYIVTLTVIDLNGKEGYDTVAITVNEPEAPTAVINTVPAAVSGIVTITAPSTVYFDAYESEPDPECEFGCEIVSYEWDFGDGTTGTGITENHTYDIPGLYFVTLTVTDFYGNTGCDTVTIIANEAEAPNAEINTVPDPPPTGSAPFTVYFDAYESAADPECEFGCEIVSYGWDFGDGSSGIGITTSHTYSNIGTYTAILTVIDSNGKKGYDSVEIKVEKAPNAEINTVPDPPTGVAPFTVYFDAYESASESGIVSYAWNFGDGSTGTGITTSHTYSSSTVDYTAIVILTITDANGYKAYDSVEIVIDCGCPEE